MGQHLQFLRPPKKEFAVLFVVGPRGVPLALAGVLQDSAMVGDMARSPAFLPEVVREH
jgi:hypothetical protein